MPTDGAADEATSATEAAAPGDGGDPDAEPCVAEPDWAEPGSTVPQYATCEGRPGVDLYSTTDDCGRCGHSCGNDLCKGGRCETALEQDGAGSTINVLGAINTDIYYARGYYLLDALGPLGTPRTIADLSTFFPDGSDQGFRYILGGITQRAGLGVVNPKTFVRTRAELFSLASMTLTPIADLNDNDQPGRGLAATSDAVYVTTKSEIVRVANGADAGAHADDAPKSIYMAAHDDTVYWLEQPWNESAGAAPGTMGATLLKKRVGTTTSLVHTHPPQLTALVVGADGLYFMELGGSGGIVRLPYDATPTTNATRLAGDSNLSEAAPFLTTDASYVYWMSTKMVSGNVYGEIWKRAKCGGAKIRLGEAPFPHGFAERGTRLYFGSDQELRSIAK